MQYFYSCRSLLLSTKNNIIICQVIRHKEISKYARYIRMYDMSIYKQQPIENIIEIKLKFKRNIPCETLKKNLKRKVVYLYNKKF